MKSICLLVFAALLMAAPLALWSADTADGAALYKSKCAACHGDKGEGKAPVKMPAVKGTPMTAEKLVDYITKGDTAAKVHAKPIAGVDADQASAIAEFVKALN